jgi:hypothetical protein
MIVRPLLLLGALAAALLAAAPPAAAATRCDRLDRAGFERLGEQAMGRMTGSSAVHAALDRRMIAVMGPAAAARMHELMGRRFAGCATGSAGWAWMRAGAWRHMSAADWRRVRAAWMGPAMMRGGSSGWSAAAIAVAAGLAGAALVLLVMRGRRRPAHP